jgi:hypothetical protein
VFVDVETGVHTAVRKIRQALGDSIRTPAFVETVPGKGYRFVAEVEVISGAPPPGLDSTYVEPSPAPDRDRTNGVTAVGFHDHESRRTAAASSARIARSETAVAWQRRSKNPALLVMGFVAIAMVTAWVAWTWLNGGAPASRITLAVLPFQYLGSDPEHDYLAAGLTEETGASLEGTVSARAIAISRAAMVCFLRPLDMQAR